MIKLRLAAVLAMLLVGSAAEAGSRATYRFAGQPIVFELDDKGSVRIDLNDDIHIVVREGVAYIVGTDDDDRLKVARLDDVVTVMHQVEGAAASFGKELEEIADLPRASPLALARKEARVVAGVPGVHIVATATSGRSVPVDIVMSEDAALRPIGAAMGLVIDHFAGLADLLPERYVNAIGWLQQLGGVLVTGMPLSIDDGLVLTAFKAGADVPASPIALPRAPLTIEQLRAEIASDLQE